MPGSQQKFHIFVNNLTFIMRPSTLNELKERNFLSEDQFQKLEPVYSARIISVFYELRILLYLGVMLFTTGIGILIYENIGELGHTIAIGSLFILTAWCAHYAMRHAPPFTTGKAIPPSPYFDYIVLLGCLLFISVLAYLQVQYALFDEGMGLTTLITAAFFFAAAYRYDHLGVLSLAITALASFFSISVSPQKWYDGDFFSESNLHMVAIVFGAILASASLMLDKRKIKQHFTFAYINFCSLIYLSGATAGLFSDEYYQAIYLFLLFAGCGLLTYYAQQKRSFLFMLYAFVFGYIGLTYLVSDVIEYVPELWFFYLLASCGGFVYFVIRFKSYFKRA
jgi:hypothetical protein